MSVEAALCGITIFGAVVLSAIAWRMAKDAREAVAALEEMGRADEAR